MSKGLVCIYSHVEVLKSNPILSVGSLEQGFENVEIIPRNFAGIRAISDLEEYSKLRAIYASKIAVRCDGGNERILVQESVGYSQSHQHAGLSLRERGEERQHRHDPLGISVCLCVCIERVPPTSRFGLRGTQHAPHATDSRLCRRGCRRRGSLRSWGIVINDAPSRDRPYHDVTGWTVTGRSEPASDGNLGRGK